MARLPGNTIIPGGDEQNPCVAQLLETAFYIGMNMKAGTDCDFNLMAMMRDGLAEKNFDCPLDPEVKKARDTLVDYVDRVGQRIDDAPRGTGVKVEASKVECLTTSNLFDKLVLALGIILPEQSISASVNGQRSRDPKYLT